MATTIEEASTCPKCHKTGTASAPMKTNKPGTTVRVYTCMNSRCRWYNTGWPVQFNPDGSIPDAKDRTQDDREPRRFPAVNDVLFNQRREAIMKQADQINGTNGGEVGS